MDIVQNLVSAEALRVVKALCLLILAFIIASIVKSLIIKLLEKTKLGRTEGQDTVEAATQKRSVLNYIGQFAYLIVFLMFVPGIFSSLGVSEVAEPILKLMNSIWGYIPNILAAAIILVVGTLVAKLVRQLLIPVFHKIKVDELQDRTGVKVENESKLSETLAFIVYIFILIPVVIVALQALNVSVITVPAVTMLEEIFAFIPNVIVAILLIIVGVFLGRLVENLITRLLSSTGIDSKLKELAGEKSPNFNLSRVLGVTANVVIVIFFVVQGCNILNLKVLTDIGNAVIGYMPRVLAALLIALIALFGAEAAGRALKKNSFAGLALAAKIVIYATGGFMMLNQLGIASKMVGAAFLIVLAAVGIALSIAFGIGGRDTAKKLLDKWVK